MYHLGNNLVPKLLNSGNMYVKMPVMPKRNFIFQSLCTRNALCTGIIGIGISALLS
ncbi:hypothetical protein MA16_Dca011334 [Dendrobium catenatum]|uniref:Uncharacterized protein n=1 Tax=Dendrobium catenatum TaxID=906689 RepID=A0A2I0WIU5_9ASPA|nr:hypothetical protein MA16_Dca011334 [Dendrobium catenatum]